jgi:hypothetical protein
VETIVLFARELPPPRIRRRGADRHEPGR